MIEVAMTSVDPGDYRAEWVKGELIVRSVNGKKVRFTTVVAAARMMTCIGHALDDINFNFPRHTFNRKAAGLDT